MKKILIYTMIAMILAAGCTPKNIPKTTREKPTTAYAAKSNEKFFTKVVQPTVTQYFRVVSREESRLRVDIIEIAQDTEGGDILQEIAIRKNIYYKDITVGEDGFKKGSEKDYNKAVDRVYEFLEKTLF